MPKIICTAPKPRTSKAQILQTESEFKSIYAKHFGTARGLTILWTLSPQGQTFQAGKPADIYLAMIEVENGLTQSRREPAMWDFTNSWAEIMGLDIERLMVIAADSDTVTEFLNGNRNRLRPLSRPGFLISTIAHMLNTRRSGGFAQLRANL